MVERPSRGPSSVSLVEFQATVIAVAIVAFALVSARVGRLALTMPMVFVAVGALTDAVGLIDIDLGAEGVAILGEVTLAVILFGDAVRIDASALRREVAIPARLLLVGLPLTVGLGTLLFLVLVPSLSIWEAALVAAILSPTDAALGQAVVEDRAVPQRVRQGLNVESGFNDGLIVPAVLLFLALATGENDGDTGFWVEFVIRQVALGLVIGLAAGWLGGRLLSGARRAGWVEGIYAQLATLSVAVAAFAGALAADANGFIAAFVAGIAFGWACGPDLAEHFDEYTEDTGRLLAIVAFFVFGNLFVNQALANTTVAIVICALGALTVMRMAPVALALSGMGIKTPTKLFAGWFGPRGLASILFGLLLLEEETAQHLGAAEELFAIVAWTVVASVVLHGLTAAHGAARYGRWYAEMVADGDDMAESMPTEDHRARWGTRPDD